MAKKRLSSLDFQPSSRRLATRLSYATLETPPLGDSSCEPGVWRTASDARLSNVSTTPSDSRPAAGLPNVTIFYYNSLVELRGLFNAAIGAGLHAVLALDSQFMGHLPSLIRRRDLAAQLILTAADEAFPRLPDGAATNANELQGWRTIAVQPAWLAAVCNTLQSMPRDGHLEIYWPAWRWLDAAAIDAACTALHSQHRRGCAVTLGTYQESA